MRILALDNCPNLIELIDSFEIDDNLFIVTKFYPAGNLLSHVIKDEAIKPLEEAKAKKIIKQVALGIQDLHSRNIVHRNIKL